jgi:hypothetical protein
VILIEQEVIEEYRDVEIATTDRARSARPSDVTMWKATD